MIETDNNSDGRINVIINDDNYVVSEVVFRLLKRGMVPEPLEFLGTSVREIEDRKFLVKYDGGPRVATEITLNGTQMMMSRDDYATLLRGKPPRNYFPYYRYPEACVIETSTDNFVVINEKDDKNDKNDKNARITVSNNDNEYVVSEEELQLLRSGIVPDSLHFLETGVWEIKDRKFLVEDDGKDKFFLIILNGKRMTVTEDEYEMLLRRRVPSRLQHHGTHVVGIAKQ